jgi:hypothetical protein
MQSTIFYFLDDQLNILAAFDTYKSAIFTGRYYEAGDFELYIPATQKALELARAASFVTRADKTTVCGIIERKGIQTNGEEGDFLLIAGRDAAALLERRIVWKQTTYSGSAEQIIRNLIETAFISPDISARAVSNFALAAAAGVNDQVRVQYNGDSVSTAVQAICKTTGSGYRVNLDLVNRRFVFELYQGKNRSFAQNANPYVVFSSDFGNLISTTYEEDATAVKNVAQIAGEGQGNERVKVSVGTATGLARNETFINAQRKSDNAGEFDAATYENLLKEDGTQQLAALIATKNIDGEIAPAYNFELGRDYFLGDIVQIANEYGYSMQPRIIEVIESWAPEGYTCVPTFEQPNS